MSERHFPSRVIVYDHESVYCRDVNRISGKTCLSDTGKCRLSDTDTWWFCGSANDGRLSVEMRNISVNHCHLFGVQQLAACHHKHTPPISETLNGKTQRGSLCERLLLGASRLCDSVQLATATCSYAVPSSVESLDLAVSCLQRMSGAYFINRSVPCVMSVCGCEQKTVSVKHCQPSIDVRCRPRRRKKPLPATSQVSDRLSTTRKELLAGSVLRRGQQRCTRSLSKQLIDSSDSQLSSSVHGMADGHVIAADETEQSVTVQSTDDECSHTDEAVLTADLLHVNSATRHSTSAVAAAADAAAIDDSQRMLVKTVMADGCRSVMKYRRHRQQMKKKRLRRHSSRTTLTHQLRSHTIALSLTSRYSVVTDSRRYQQQQPQSASPASNRRCVKTARKSTQNSVVFSDYVNARRQATRKHRQVMTSSHSDAAAVPYNGAMKLSQDDVKQSESSVTDCAVSKAMSALSVDVNLDYDDVCHSPTSPLPTSVSTIDSYDQCNNLLEQAAALLTRKRCDFWSL